MYKILFVLLLNFTFFSNIQSTTNPQNVFFSMKTDTIFPPYSLFSAHIDGKQIEIKYNGNITIRYKKQNIKTKVNLDTAGSISWMYYSIRDDSIIFLYELSNSETGWVQFTIMDKDFGIKTYTLLGGFNLSLPIILSNNLYYKDSRELYSYNLNSYQYNWVQEYELKSIDQLDIKNQKILISGKSYETEKVIEYEISQHTGKILSEKILTE